MVLFSSCSGNLSNVEDDDFWYQSRLPYQPFENSNYDKICGELPLKPTYKRGEDFEKYKIKRDAFSKIRTKNSKCFEKQFRKTKNDTIHDYYYAQSTQDYEIDYPLKPEGHSYWKVDMFLGRINSLEEIALTKEQKENKKSLIKDKNYKGEIIYTLPGNRTSIYYNIRSTPSKSDYYNGLRNAKESLPAKWTEIKGIEINQKMYDYLKYRCEVANYFCHFNDYKEELTKEQSKYIKNVKWDIDKTWTIKNKIDHSNPWK